ncbi:hypothetical protein IV500_19870 [Paeniglutamicibacter antarcticus]|uniref:Uncharacterized protein n=1 Tax=Arthrobacter terrae TaxID=2935737 RepID=A0A931CUG2_9MICC|nr:hypothetical protein [Arthrobacter terrae]MBG0741619.1 hypothetical protein [Arthrobacter terrae]
MLVAAATLDGGAIRALHGRGTDDDGNLPGEQQVPDGLLQPLYAPGF